MFSKIIKIVSIVLVFYASTSLACDAEYMLLSDLHFNPALKTSMPFAPRKKGADMDALTFNTLFDQLKKYYHDNKMQGVITLGDFVGHGVSLKQRESIQRILYDKFSEFNAPIYYGFGNNDSLLGNYQAYAKHGKSPYALLKKQFPNLLSGFIFDKSLSDCSVSPQKKTCLYRENKNVGLYSIQLQPGLRLINMNTVMLNGDYYFNDQHQAELALSWLENELDDALQKQDAVLIAMHVPPTIDLYSGKFHYREKWLHRNIYHQQFMKIIHRSLNKGADLVAIVAGHTHHDELHIIQHPKKNLPVFVIPALSTMHGNSPAFKTLCLNKNNSGWRLDRLDAYAWFSRDLAEVSYDSFPINLCQTQSVDACLLELVRVPDHLLRNVKHNYFAANPHQKDKLKTKANYLFLTTNIKT